MTINLPKWQYPHSLLQIVFCLEVEFLADYFTAGCTGLYYFFYRKRKQWFPVPTTVGLYIAMDVIGRVESDAFWILAFV